MKEDAKFIVFFVIGAFGVLLAGAFVRDFVESWQWVSLGWAFISLLLVGVFVSVLSRVFP